MILHSSAIIAVLLGEPEARQFAEVIRDADLVRLSSATHLEVSIVLGSKNHSELDEWISDAEASIHAFDSGQVLLAREAYVQFGKGSSSKARLNFGDCFSYALAKILDEPLLFRGDDFTHTDVTPALKP